MFDSPIVIWLGIGGFAIVGWAFFAALELKGKWTRTSINEATGVEQLRSKLNPVTDSFLALAADQMLVKAASKTDNPYLERFKGRTLDKYREVCRQFVIASYAHDALASVVLDAERVLSARGLAAAIKLPKVSQINEQPIEVKNVDARTLSSYVTPPTGAPSLPSFSHRILPLAARKWCRTSVPA